MKFFYILININKLQGFYIQTLGQQFTASFFCHREIVKILLDNGADKNLKNNTGRTALETVPVPFNEVKDIYDQFRTFFRPPGIDLDYEKIKMTRPKIAEMSR